MRHCLIVALRAEQRSYTIEGHNLLRATELVCNIDLWFQPHIPQWNFFSNAAPQDSCKCSQ
jgi:hypothetical protein